MRVLDTAAVTAADKAAGSNGNATAIPEGLHMAKLQRAAPALLSGSRVHQFRLLLMLLLLLLQLRHDCLP
jgi:hypothetical protein